MQALPVLTGDVTQFTSIATKRGIDAAKVDAAMPKTQALWEIVAHLAMRDK